MRKVDQRNKFRRDFRLESRGIYRSLLDLPDGELWKVVQMLANNIPLSQKYRDHALHGDWEGSRECHIRPDFLLVYTYIGNDGLYLERLGSHAKIFGM